jgi:hypothetical protein
MQGATGRVIVGLLWLTILLVIAGAWSAGAARAKAAAPPAPAASPRPVVESGLILDELLDETGSETPSEPRTDLYGNEIEEAVSDYRVDFYGDVYERHSPETAIVELTAPSL